MKMNGFRGTGETVQSAPDEWSDEKKIQYYLAHMGFDIGTDSNGNSLIDGAWGNRSRIAAIMLQDWNRTTETTDEDAQPITAKADTQTLAALEEFNKMAVSFDDIKREFIPENYQAEPLPKEEWGHLSDTELEKYILLDTRYDEGKALMNPKIAVAWANMTYTAHKDGIPIDHFYPSYDNAGYRHYPDQVKLYAKELLKIPGYTDAATPVFDIGTAAADAYIRLHEEDYKNDPDYFSKNGSIGPVGAKDSEGEALKLAGRGGSWHGNGTAIDLGMADPGGYGDGKGYATTEQVKWLEGISDTNESGKSAKDFGFYPFLKSGNETIVIDGEEVNNYAETWHLNYMGY